MAPFFAILFLSSAAWWLAKSLFVSGPSTFPEWLGALCCLALALVSVRLWLEER